MNRLRWGIIGFGEAGSAFAEHLNNQHTIPVRITDPVLNLPVLRDHVRQRLSGLSVKILPDIPQLMADCDVVLSLVTPSVAVDISSEAGAAWQRGLFLELNSVSPKEKSQMAAFFREESFVDGAILGSIAGTGAKSPLALAGPRAGQAQDLLTSTGFNVSVTSLEVGGASALKMCRSIFMKGIECLLIETLMAADASNIAGLVLKSIEETFKSYGFQPMVEMLVTTHAAHCGRRSHEMQRVAQMLEEMGLPHPMSSAACNLLAISQQTGITEQFKASVPNDPKKVIRYLKQFYAEDKQ
jgi:3-hydroxyisobutyrate dehydrogenase-like beta-hydroxyacid dehydrogenase